MRWKTYYIISEISKTDAVTATAAGAARAATETSSARFQINNPKIYVSVLVLSINDNIKFLKNQKQGFKSQ